MKKVKEKKQSVKIIQITSCSKNYNVYIYGLGDDQKIYEWIESSIMWVLTN